MRPADDLSRLLRHPAMQPTATAAGLRQQLPAARRAAAQPAGRRAPRRVVAAYQGRVVSSTDSDVADIIHLAKHRLAKKGVAPPQGGMAEFMHKVGGTRQLRVQGE